MKKVVNLFSTVALSLCFLCACGGNSATTSGGDGSVKSVIGNESSENATPEVKQADADSKLNADIVYWSSYTESSNYGQSIKAAADAFMKENPGVKI